ncbi:SUF system NifU family Fe-S cluster assembly protein [candidate division BRC1 bacterium HGW-BRC1-1]|jgi:nitrogen fixation NifU-like protein|nr:MAG: SUF system NifU family Fe-S cluster assembly protein [candidate division BRC1 bacterium HGW-BRC1-1]
MSDLRELYQEVILDHNKKPRNYGELPEATHHAIGHNRLCGDRITIHLQVEDGIVTNVRFEGSGCAISTASASIMTETLKGRTLEDARHVFETFHGLVTGKGCPGGAAAELGKLAAFSGVCDYPARVKCATLAWHTFVAATKDQDAPVSSE